MTKNKTRTSRSPRGTVVHEAAIAIVLAGAMLACAAQLMTLSARQNRSQQQRIAATREVANVMEQLMARSWEQITPETAAAVELSADCQAALPNPELAIEIAAQDDGAKQLNIKVSWKHTNGHYDAPVHLVAWKYPLSETTE